MQNITTLPVLIHWEDNKFVAQVKAPGFLFTTAGDSVPKVLENLQHLIADYLAHEGATAAYWQGITISAIAFECTYNLSAFFEHYKELKISAIANRAGINTNLLQQYVSGNKRASESQAKKIETAIHHLANELKQIVLS
jgi:predicted RNase H-like HicB family nuclease